MATISHEREAHESANITGEALQLAEQRGVVSELFQLRSMTEDLFPGKHLVDVHHDPEIPNYSIIVFNVVARGTVEHAISRENLWVDRLLEIVSHRPSQFCLSIDLQD